MALMINGLYPGELMPDATVAGCIDIFENIWPNPQETINAVEQECLKTDSGVYWERAGTVGSGAFQNLRTNLLLNISHSASVFNNPLMQNIHNQLYTSLLATTNPYAHRYGIQDQFFHEGYSMLKYRSGEEYKAHYDGGTMSGRAVSALVYLNSDYEGGEIEFPHFGIKIKPEAGMMLLFPSNFAYRHIAHPIRSGTKYSLVTWIRDQPYGNSK
jgi:hypothetical protein